MKKIDPIIIFGLLSWLFFYSCADNYPVNIDSPDEVILKSIKILNSGSDGNTVLEGRIDENTKTIWFPRIDPETNLSAIRFQAEMSDGAKLEKESYIFDFEEGKDSKTIVIKIINNKRFREYFVTLRLNIPVYGADFGKSQIYDNTNNELGNPIYPTFISMSTRGSGFDGKHVLIVTRAKGLSHLLSIEDLMKGEIKPIPLNLNGVAGGTFPVNCGAQINGHTYIANLSGGLASPLKIYHWTDPAQAPQVIANINKSTIPESGKRHGDNLSVSIDKNGNGYMFFGDNAATQILRLKVTNFTEISEPTILPTQSGVTAFMNMNRVGNTDEYLLTGFDAPIMVTNSSGVLAYKMDNNSIPMRSSDPRVVYFNNERYLLVTTAARRGEDAVVMYLYDITKGSNITEALKIFEAGEKKPLYQYSLLGPVNTAPSTQTGWYVTKDEQGKDDKLMLYAASTDAGFVIVEFPKKSLED